MSAICLFVVQRLSAEKQKKYIRDIQTRVTAWARGVKFSVDWPEPALSRVQPDALVVNITDSPHSDNCEMFLLPDGGMCNGKTEPLPFKRRAALLADIAQLFAENADDAALYIGQSGTPPDEFLDAAVTASELADYLNKNAWRCGAAQDLHIRIAR